MIKIALIRVLVFLVLAGVIILVTFALGAILGV